MQKFILVLGLWVTLFELDSPEVKPLYGANAVKPELQLTIKTHWQQIINISAHDYLGNKQKSSVYYSFRRSFNSEKTLSIAPGNNLSSSSSRVMQLMNRIIKRNLSSATLDKRFTANTHYEFICVRYKIPTSDSHQMKCFQPDLTTIGFIIVVNLIAFIFFIHRCCWRASVRIVEK